RLLLERVAQSAEGSWQARMMIDRNEPRYVVSRLGANGPILDSTKALGFGFWSGKDASLEVVETDSDESQLVEMRIVLSPVPPDIRLQVDLIVGGVIFEDGTITKDLGAADFDALGKVTLRFLRPASAKTSVCHSIKLFQGQELIGYKR